MERTMRLVLLQAERELDNIGCYNDAIKTVLSDTMEDRVMVISHHSPLEIDVDKLDEEESYNDMLLRLRKETLCRKV